MSPPDSDLVQVDYLIIGSGIAGLSFALKVCQHGTVAVITKKEEAESNTNYAQGGIASVLSAQDTFELHIADTLKGGVDLNRREAVELLVREGPDRIRELMAWGVDFSKRKDESGEEIIDLGREGGHSRNRILHVADMTGRELERVLLEKAKESGNVHVYENHIAIDLITEHQMEKRKRSTKDLHCWGAYVLDIEGQRVLRFLAGVTLLCTGGVGQLYSHTTNPRIATGDGLAMAYRAGAQVANLEFMQFHPTSLYHPGRMAFLISEAVRGEGGILRLSDGHPFMKDHDSRGDLAPRDVVARAIDRELKKSGEECVYLDVTHLGVEFLTKRFPNIYGQCLSQGIDAAKSWIPVVPAAHYMCGGVVVNLDGQTAIKGLYACGEVTHTGVHGANRLASNSLLEAVVFAHRAAQVAIDEAGVQDGDYSSVGIPIWNDEGTFDSEEWVVISHDRAEIQLLMTDYVGIVRSDKRLQRARERIHIILREIDEFYRRTPVTGELVELRNLATVAELVIRSALMRKESRGLHYTIDYPQRDDKNWLKDTVIKSKGAAGGEKGIENCKL